MKTMPRVPLQVCFYSSGVREPAELVSTLEALLAGDPPGNAVALTRPGIPTRVYITTEQVPWDEADITVVVFLVDTTVAASPEWRAWARARMHEQDGQARRLVPVALSPAFQNLATAPLHGVRLVDVPPGAWSVHAQPRVFHALWRALRGREAGRLFISHAKSDGRELAEKVRDYIQSSTNVRALFDTITLLEGERFEPQLEREVEASCALLVVLTDAWSGRFWCQRELLVAKQIGLPVVVLDAVGDEVPRQFPYLGNGAMVRWVEGQEAALVGRVMLEAARDAFVDRHLVVLEAAGWLPAGAGTLDRPPELATLARWRGQPVLVHPDPPLALHELALLEEAAPEVRILTPTQALMQPTADDRPLQGLRIALSVSDVPAEEQTRLGMTPKHVRRAYLALARHLLAVGAKVDYGGDQRQGGYTEALVELVRAHRQANVEVPEQAVRMHLPWPNSLNFTLEDRASLPEGISLCAYELPGDVPADGGVFLPPTTVEARFAWARSLTEVRSAMAAETDARVLLGGAWTSLGRLPGLAEEALLHLEAGKPVYLLGGFGGMTAAVAAAVRGERPEQLTEAWQLQSPLALGLRDHYNTWVAGLAADAPLSTTARMPVDYDDLLSRFAGFGVAGLNNGLTVEQNLRLMATQDLTEAIGLVLLGLQLRLSGTPATA